MATPRYFHFYDLPEVDRHYGVDEPYSSRCDRASLPLFQWLETEIRVLRRVPADFFSSTTWGLCHCIGRLVDELPLGTQRLESACAAESTQILKLALRLVEYDLASAAGLDHAKRWISYIRSGGAPSELEVAS